VFKEIGDRLGPFDLSAIPIGAYEPRDFMRPMHIGPKEAVAVHQDVRSKKSVGVHCCTFFLTTGARCPTYCCSSSGPYSIHSLACKIFARM
jgi:N-acyl-phosphatidylethanolamine-hydrolysing phospholipase D